MSEPRSDRLITRGSASKRSRDALNVRLPQGRRRQGHRVFQERRQALRAPLQPACPLAGFRVQREGKGSQSGRWRQEHASAWCRWRNNVSCPYRQRRVLTLVCSWSFAARRASVEASSLLKYSSSAARSRSFQALPISPPRIPPLLKSRAVVRTERPDSPELRQARARSAMV